MKRHLILLTAVVMLVPRVGAPAAHTEHSPSVQQERETDFVRKSRRSAARDRSLEDRIRFFAERVLRLDEQEVEEFVALAHIVADFIGVNLQSEDGGGGYAGGFVLILVLFILLVIIGAGFGLGYGG